MGAYEDAIERAKARKGKTETLRPGFAYEAARRRARGEDKEPEDEQSYLSKVVEKAFKETSVGIALRAAGAVDEGPGDIGTAGNIASGVLGFVGDPATYATGGVGAILGKGVAKKLALKGIASKVVPSAVAAGTQLGGLEAVREAAVGQFDIGRIAEAGIAGAALGPAGAIKNPVARAAAEVASMAVVPPILEQRAPTLQDVEYAAGTVGGFRIVNAITRRLAALAKKETVSRKEYMEATGVKQAEVPVAAERKSQALEAAKKVAEEGRALSAAFTEAKKAGPVTVEVEGQSREGLMVSGGKVGVPAGSGEIEFLDPGRVTRITDAQGRVVWGQPKEAVNVEAKTETQAETPTEAGVLAEEPQTTSQGPVNDVLGRPAPDRVTATPVSRKPNRLDAIINRARIEEQVRGRAEFLDDSEALPRAIVDEFLANTHAALPADVRRTIDGRIRAVTGIESPVDAIRELAGESVPFKALDSLEKGLMAQLDVLNEMVRTVKQVEQPALPAESPRVQAARAKLESSEAELRKVRESQSLFSTGIDWRDLAASAKVFRDELGLGWAKFSDYVRHLATKFGAAIVRGHKSLIRDTWEAERAKNPKLDQPGDVDALTQGMPDGPAETTARPRDLPKLAVPVTDPLAKDVLRGVDEIRTAAAEPRLVTHAEANAVSSERIVREGPELTRRLVNGTWVAADSPETFAQVKILNALGQRSFETGDLNDLIRATMNYRQGRTQTAQALEAGKGATIETMTLPEQKAFFNREALVQPPKEIEKQILRAQKREAESPSAQPEGRSTGRPRRTAAEITQQWAEEVKKVEARLRARGHDVDRALRGELDPVAQQAFVRDVHALKASRADQLYEWWSNAILSGPATQIVNAVGNAAHAGWYFTAERISDAMVSSIARGLGFKSDGARFGELKHVYQAFVENWGRSAKEFFGETWRSEIPQFYKQRGLEAETAYGYRTGSIPGKFGKAVRTPWRTLSAVDDFMKSQVFEMERAALAYRQARAEGHKGTNLQQRMRQLLEDPSSEVNLRATDVAIRLAFQERGTFTDATKKLVHDIPGGRYVLPFITTPFNIVKSGVRKSPFGSIKLATEVLKAHKTGEWSGISQRVAEQVLAWGATLALAYSNDPADPWITGGSDPNRKYAIKIGGVWWNYGRIEPFSTTVGLLVDAIARVRAGGDLFESLKAPFDAMLERIDNQTFFTGLSDFMKAARYQDANYVLDWTAKFPSSWVPNLIRAPLRATSDDVPQRRVWGKGALRAENALKRGLQSFEVMEDLPKYDLWGRTVPKDGAPIPHTDWVFRVLSPVGERKYVESIGDRLIARWNAANPHDPAEFRPPNPYFIEDGQTFYFTDQEYDTYTRESGRLTQERVIVAEARGGLNMNAPKKRDIKLLEKIIESSRTRVRNSIKRARRKAERNAA